jgi:protein PhnA
LLPKQLNTLKWNKSQDKSMPHKHRSDNKRKEMLEAMAKEFVRRSGHKCELCGVSGVPFRAVEIEPLPAEPDFEKALFVCESCENALHGKEIREQESHFLKKAVWSEMPVVQVSAVRLCRQLAAQGIQWAEDALASLYLSPEIEQWIDVRPEKR